MEYFLISNSTNLKEIGHYIQCKGMPDGYNYKWFEQPNSMTNLTNDSFPDFEPDLVFELEKKAKLTDIVSTSNISAKGLLMNEKTKNIFEQCNLGQHKFYPATVIYKNEKHQYFWLHILNLRIEDINLKESKFYKSEFGFDKLGYLSFNGYEEAFRIARETDCFIRPEKIIMNKNYINIFYLPISNSIYISNNLKTILDKNNINGMEIKQLN